MVLLSCWKFSRRAFAARHYPESPVVVLIESHSYCLLSTTCVPVFRSFYHGCYVRAKIQSVICPLTDSFLPASMKTPAPMDWRSRRLFFRCSPELRADPAVVHFAEQLACVSVVVSLCVVVYAPTGPGASFSEAPFSRPWTRKCVRVRKSVFGVGA